MNRLHQQYTEKVSPAIQKQFGMTSVLAVPRLSKIVLNTGISQPQDPRARKEVVNNVAKQFELITGQKAQVTVARKAVSNFKLRQGDPLGVAVTLRGERMWEFLDKLISAALPRVKDFQGVPRTAFDGQGNYSLGIEEQIIFPEIQYDQIDAIRSLQIIFVTTTRKNDEAFALLEQLGMPFKKQ
jgi:large subunit ribosomal protein L5